MLLAWYITYYLLPITYSLFLKQASWIRFDFHSTNRYRLGKQTEKSPFAPREAAKSLWNNGDCCFTGDVFYRIQHAK